MTPAFLRPAGFVVLAFLVCSCSLQRSMRESTDALRVSSGLIKTNTDAVLEATRVSQAMLPAMQRMESLVAPLHAVAGLDTVLRDVSSLRVPLQAVGSLGTPLARVAELGDGLDSAAMLAAPLGRVAGLGPVLGSVAELRGALEDVAALQVTLKAVAELKAPLEEVGRLRPSLERVGVLSDALTPALSVLRPVWLVLGVLLLLAAWGLVTFVAVRLALSTSR
jgi:hypothetical protein